MTNNLNHSYKLVYYI